MPLLGASGGVADHLCLFCQKETHLTTVDWITYDDAPHTFSTPPCPNCGATESFEWHDWTYLQGKERPRNLDPDVPFDDSPKPDHTHPGAKQMVLIARVAQAKGRKKRVLKDKDPRKYAQPPTAPRQDEVRGYVKQLRREG